MSIKIAILTPTRERVVRFEEHLDSILKTKSNRPHIKVRVFAYVDNDDPQLEHYQTLNDKKDFYLQVLAPASVSINWNRLAETALEWGADVLIMGNDDVVYHTMGWDEILIDELEQKYDQGYEDIYCAWFEDGINGERHCAFPIVSRKWVATLEYFTPGIFNFGYNDTWIFDVAKRVGRIFFIPSVLAEHKHFSVDKSEMDNTYKKNRTQAVGNLYQKDEPIYNKTAKIRQEHANKLLRVIEK